ncbi:MAG: hypothetical protein ACYC27_11495 [Armatimonadota bacterium]
MLRQIRLVMCALFLVTILVISTSSAFAYLRSYRTIDQIASDSDYIITGKVIKISDGEKISAESNHWKLPLIKKHAVLDVYRAYPSKQDVQSIENNKVTIDFLAIDFSIIPGVINGPMFPQLVVGNVYAFPMIKSPGDLNKIVLLSDEDLGYLIPGVKEQIPDAVVGNAFDFICSEIAGTLAYGSYEDIYKTGRYFAFEDIPEQVSVLVEKNVHDKDQWFDIAVATYCSLSIPRLRINELDSWNGRKKSQVDLVRIALDHASPQNLEEQFVSSVIQHASDLLWASSTALNLNDQYIETTKKHLLDELNSDKPAVMTLKLSADVIKHYIKDNNHPFIDIAVKVSRKLLATKKNASREDTSAASEIITIYGSDDDFMFLTDEIKKAAKSSKDSFDKLWRGTNYRKGILRNRKIILCNALIDNKSDYSSDLRFCDLAVSHLQHETGEKFGFDLKQSKSERNKAVAKAKQWLAKNPDKIK